MSADRVERSRSMGYYTMAEQQKDVEKKQAQSAKSAPAQDAAKQDKLKYLVRVQNTDLDGSKHTLFALTKIKGVSVMFAHAACRAAKISPTQKIGSLSDSDVKKLNDVVAHPATFNIPTWLLNRRADPESGEDIHLHTSDLDFTKSNDMKLLQKIKSYKGLRHAKGLTVRGQRTRSNFRRNKGKVASVKKAQGRK